MSEETTTSHSKGIHPGWNSVSREVMCPHCKYIIDTTDIPAVCVECRSPLVRVLYSLITGERITGAE